MVWEGDQTANDAIDEDAGKNVSEYEQCREERIKENLERMQKLGIFELSRAFQSSKPAITRKTRKSKTPRPLSPVRPPQPIRRSSRLQNVTPVSYTEVPVGKSLKSLDFEDDLLREAGSKPEIYTEEHEKLLGSTKMNWTLFVDGYGKDGKRIYDPVRGKTCHQCRQKTLGRRTHCSKCNMVQGQFCGDCLYMRYGEHVLEANCNPDWICPVCRGICNCSLCRQAKGWAPTGPLYKKIKRLGYESVAHYLIQTRRASTNPENNVPNSVPVSDVEATSSEKESSEACNDAKELLNSQTAEKIVDYEATETDDNKITREASTYPSTESRAEHGLLRKHFPGNIGMHLEDSGEKYNCGNDAPEGVLAAEVSGLVEYNNAHYKTPHVELEDINGNKVAVQGGMEPLLKPEFVMRSSGEDQVLLKPNSKCNEANIVLQMREVKEICSLADDEHAYNKIVLAGAATSKLYELTESSDDQKGVPEVHHHHGIDKHGDHFRDKKKEISSLLNQYSDNIPIAGNNPNSDELPSLEVILNVKHISSDANDGEPSHGILAPETMPRKRRAAEPIPAESIAERLRQRRNQNN